MSEILLLPLRILRGTGGRRGWGLNPSRWGSAGFPGWGESAWKEETASRGGLGNVWSAGPGAALVTEMPNE